MDLLGEPDTRFSVLSCRRRGSSMNYRSDFVAQTDLSPDERELIQELVEALRTIRYGSIALTVHEGRLIEIQKTEKIRRKA
jgi:hypothetical protein